MDWRGRRTFTIWRPPVDGVTLERDAVRQEHTNAGEMLTANEVV